MGFNVTCFGLIPYIPFIPVDWAFLNKDEGLNDLAMLRTLGLADSAGRGRGARWMLKGSKE